MKSTKHTHTHTDESGGRILVCHTFETVAGEIKVNLYQKVRLLRY